MGNKESDFILENTEKYYYNNPDKCSLHNWIARMVAFLEFGKKVWPEPNEKQINAFISVTGRKRKYWGRRE